MSDLLERAKAGEEIDVYLLQNVEYRFQTLSCTPINEYVTLGKGRCTFEITPDKEVIEQGLDALDKQIEMVRAESHVKIEALKDRKAHLLSLTHQG